MTPAYESVDKLQNLLARDVFHYTKDAKKAAGRALGTLVEIITFYLLKSWGFEHSMAIERRVAEYGNSEITHNVEYSIHPILREYSTKVERPNSSVTANQILSETNQREFSLVGFKTSTAKLLEKGVLKNSCVVAVGPQSHIMATLDKINQNGAHVALMEQFSKPYAIAECKRVGVEEGMKKGPQTIEKAKQGAYVAKSVSSLQKFRTVSGELIGLVYKSSNPLYSKPHAELLAEIIASDDGELLREFILTIGVVSNHGNWFTSENHNKELKVLKQSYDWLLFLTDAGLSEFITELLLSPVLLLEPARNAFIGSYTGEKGKNRFTKTNMDYEADQVLQTYFKTNESRIANWFNVIGPKNGTVDVLQSELSQLRGKNWREVYSL